MPATGRVYRLGKNQTFDFAHGDGKGVLNANVRSSTRQRTVAQTARVTTRGSDEEENVPVFIQQSYEVQCLWHECRLGETGIVALGFKAGTTGRGATGLFFVSDISEPHELDGEVVETVQLTKFPD